MTDTDKLDRVLGELAELKTALALTAQRLDALIQLHGETRTDLSDAHALAADCRTRLDRAEAIVQAGKWLFPSLSAAISAVTGWVVYQIGRGGTQ